MSDTIRKNGDTVQIEWNKYADAVDVLAGRSVYREWPFDTGTQNFIALSALKTMSEGRTLLLTTKAYQVEQVGELI